VAKIIILLSLLTGCGTASGWIWPTTPLARGDFDPLLQPYIQEFIDKCGKTYGADISALSTLESAKFVKEIKGFPDYTIGVCRWRGMLTYIEVADSYMHDPRLRELVFHELGHCILDLGHTPNIEGGIMTPNMRHQAFSPVQWETEVHKFCTLRPEDTSYDY